MAMKELVIQIIVDNREARSGLIDELISYKYETDTVKLSTNVTVAQLEVGDIICSDQVCIERKTCADFVDSFISRDIFGQMADMSRAYKKPIVILEGDSIFGIRNVAPEALRGALTGITVGFGIPIIPTRNVSQTSAQIATITRREQFRDKRSISIHGKRSHMTMPQRQVYVVAAIGAGVGPVMAGTLLKHFKSVEAVMTASIDELMEVEGIGKKTANSIREIIGSEYKS